MLVLSRTVGEVIDIGDNIKVVVVEIRGDKVRIGIDAPEEIRVDRREISERSARQSNEREGSNVNDSTAKPSLRSIPITWTITSTDTEFLKTLVDFVLEHPTVEENSTTIRLSEGTPMRNGLDEDTVDMLDTAIASVKQAEGPDAS